MMGPAQHTVTHTFGFDEGIRHLAEKPPQARQHALADVYMGLGLPFMIALSLVVPFYLLGTLLDERKDRSILFWKSMPVSDLMTVASKLLTAVVVVPVVYLLLIGVVHLGYLLLASASALHQSLPVWSTLWAPSHLLYHWLQILTYYVLNAVWFLPLFAWLLLVSSWVKSAPVIWAIGVPVGVSAVEGMFSSSHIVGRWILGHSLPVPSERMLVTNPAAAFVHLFTPQMLLSLLIAAAMLYGAVVIRGRTDEI